jgi:YD repeat-containing protein
MPPADRWVGGGEARSAAGSSTTRVDRACDLLNRLCSESWYVKIGTSTVPFKSVSYGYDDAGNRIAMSDPEGAVILYFYDSVARGLHARRRGFVPARDA